MLVCVPQASRSTCEPSQAGSDPAATTRRVALPDRRRPNGARRRDADDNISDDSRDTEAHETITASPRRGGPCRHRPGRFECRVAFPAGAQWTGRRRTRPLPRASSIATTQEALAPPPALPSVAKGLVAEVSQGRVVEAVWEIGASYAVRAQSAWLGGQANSNDRFSTGSRTGSRPYVLAIRYVPRRSPSVSTRSWSRLSSHGANRMVRGTSRINSSMTLRPVGHLGTGRSSDPTQLDRRGPRLDRALVGVIVHFLATHEGVATHLRQHVTDETRRVPEEMLRLTIRSMPAGEWPRASASDDRSIQAGQRVVLDWRSAIATRTCSVSPRWLRPGERRRECRPAASDRTCVRVGQWPAFGKGNWCERCSRRLRGSTCWENPPASSRRWAGSGRCRFSWSRADPPCWLARQASSGLVAHLLEWLRRRLAR